MARRPHAVDPFRWSRLPRFPLVYLLFIALPLSIWRSPGADRQAVAILVASLLLVQVVSATTDRAPLLWMRLFFLTGIAILWQHSRFHTNELAGLLLLFVPTAAALTWNRALSSIQRLQCGLLTLLFAGALLTTGSRGGLLALLFAGAVVLMLERRWRFFILGGLLTVGWAASGGIDGLLYDGKAQGLSFHSLLTGRPEIWRHALHAIADFSATGIGIGTYSHMVPTLYGPAGLGPLEDAHSLPLQIALDLGIGGLLAMLVLGWAAFRQAYFASWRRPAPGPRMPLPTGLSERPWAIGLFASLLAFCLFNLFDAVALGSPGSPAFFFLLGLIYALPKPRLRQRRRWRLPARGRWKLLVGAILVLLGLPSLRGARELNQAAVLGAQAIVHEPERLPAAHQTLRQTTRRTCRAGWLQGKVAEAWERPLLRDQAWAELLSCSATFVPLIASQVPEHLRLAERAVERQPSSADAHLWLARIRYASQDLKNAEHHYLRALELHPRNGVAWLEFGRLLAPTSPQRALEAFIESCHHGDPGANACLAAGATAEQLGDIESALRYYGKSRFHRARQRAAELRGRQQ